MQNKQIAQQCLQAIFKKLNLPEEQWEREKGKLIEEAQKDTYFKYMNKDPDLLAVSEASIFYFSKDIKDIINSYRYVDSLLVKREELQKSLDSIYEALKPYTKLLDRTDIDENTSRVVLGLTPEEKVEYIRQARTLFDGTFPGAI